MSNSNLDKKKEIENIIAIYTEKLALLEKKRDALTSCFIDKLKEKRIKEIKRSLKKYDLT